MSSPPVRVLIIGGYGVFGSRIARLLLEQPGLTIAIAGRSLAKARDFCNSLHGSEPLVPQAFDRDGDVKAQLAELHADIVIDAAGPFQVYGDRPYRIAEAVLEAGSDYIDIADGSDFVCRFSALERLARERGRFAISGASTCPALTAAVLRHIGRDLAIKSIEAGIAPSPMVEVGPTVLRALLTYAGRPLQVLRNGASIDALALVDSRAHEIAVVGVRPLRPRTFSLVDVPDISLLPTEWTGLEDMWFGAGTAPVSIHRLFIAIAMLSHLSGRSFAPLAGLFHSARRYLRWGEHRGGMYVRIAGWNRDSECISREWSLIVEGDDGPFIPAMAAAAIVRNVCAGRRPESGARTALREVEYADFEHFFARRKITVGVRECANPRTVRVG